MPLEVGSEVGGQQRAQLPHDGHRTSVLAWPAHRKELCGSLPCLPPHQRLARRAASSTMWCRRTSPPRSTTRLWGISHLPPISTWSSRERRCCILFQWIGCHCLPACVHRLSAVALCISDRSLTGSCRRQLRCLNTPHLCALHSSAVQQEHAAGGAPPHARGPAGKLAAGCSLPQ